MKPTTVRKFTKVCTSESERSTRDVYNVWLFIYSVPNRPRSIYQYSSMAPRLSGQNCKFLKCLFPINSQRKLGYKENNTKYRR